MAHKPDRLDLVSRKDINQELERRLRAQAVQIVTDKTADPALKTAAAKIWASSTSAKKKAAVRINGHLGGRPRKHAPCLYNKNGYHTFAYEDPVTGVWGRCPCGLTLKGEWACYTHDQEINRYRAECWMRDEIQARWEKLEEKRAQEEE